MRTSQNETAACSEQAAAERLGRGAIERLVAKPFYSAPRLSAIPLVADPAAEARALRRAIAQIEHRRAIRAELIEAVDSYLEALFAEIVADCAALTRLRSAAARLEWQAANPIEHETTERAAA
jgi:hypothetical protein